MQDDTDYEGPDTAPWGAIAFVVFAAIVVLILLAPPARSETCIASVYGTGDRDQNGTKTASGIRLANSVPSMAHKALPLRSRARVTNLRSGASIVLPVTDRGPFVRGRCVDLSHAAASALGISGLGRVSVEPAR